MKIFNKDGNQVGPRYCGFYPEGYGVKIQGDTARLDFSSNLYIVRSGFNATFEAVLSESPGMIMRHVCIYTCIYIYICTDIFFSISVE